VTFTPLSNGTATLSGTAAAGSKGVYFLTITAANGTLPNAVQLFTLTVQNTAPVLHAPAVISPAKYDFYRRHRRHLHRPYDWGSYSDAKLNRDSAKLAFFH
jgi:hypothetical protein